MIGWWYPRQPLSNACLPKQSQKSFRRKLVHIPLILSWMGNTQTKSPFSNGSLWKRGLMHTCGSSSTILDRVEMDQFRFSRLPSFSKWDLVWRLICSLRIQSTDTDLGGAKSSIWNFCTRFSDVISRGNQCRMTSRNVGYFLRLSDRKKPILWTSYEQNPSQN